MQPSTISSFCSLASKIVDQLQQAVDSFDLSVTIYEHPAIQFFGYLLPSNALSGKYTIDLPDLRLLLSIHLVFAIDVLIGAAFAAILYHTFLNNEKQNKTLLKGLISSAIILSCSLLPYAMVDIMGVHNTAIRFTICFPYVIYLFRISEAIFGYVPQGAQNSFTIYCAYFSLPVDMMFDKDTFKPIMATKQDLSEGHTHAVKAIWHMSVLCSILSPSGYVPFGKTDAGDYYEMIDLREYLNLRHLGNCFVIAVLFQQSLSLGFALGGNIVQTTLGYKIKQSMRNPIFEATSPKDFWSRRWNTLVHSIMKRGVYKPVRRHYSALIASLAVFVASGLFHEWIVHAVFMYNQQHLISEIILGSNAAFFVWNFVIIASETLLVGTGIHSIGKMLPPALVRFMIIMSSLPMAHWFGNPYLRGNYFADLEECLFLIRKA